MKRLWVILLLVFIGCATTTQNFPKPNPTGLKKGNVRIKLSRMDEVVGQAVTFTIYDNGNLVGKLGLDKPLEWDRPAGQVNLSRDWNVINGVANNNALSFQVKEGYRYELYVGWYDGFTNKSKATPDPNAGREVAQYLLNAYDEYKNEVDYSSPSTSFGTGGNKGCNIYGKIKFVEYGEDYKVRFVDYGENLKVKYVEYGEYSKGNWKMVEYGEDYKLKIVSYSEDFTVKTVSYGQGCN